MPLSKHIWDWLPINFTHHSEFSLFDNLHLSKLFICFLSRLGYFNLVMSYILFSEYSREIVLFSITYIASYLLNMSCRLIAHCAVYCDYDNSSILLSDNICTLSSFEFYLFSKYITILKKQPCKSILMPDYLSDSSMLHDIVVVHMVNNWYWTVLGTVQLKPESYRIETHGLSHLWLCFKVKSHTGPFLLTNILACFIRTKRTF